MEGSSDSAWKNSDSTRGLNTSSVSDKNLRLHRANAIELAHNSGSRKERDRVLSALLRKQGGFYEFSEGEVAADPFMRAEFGDISLRHWLDTPERSVDAVECLHIFRQVVEIVNVAHFQGIVVHNVRPSCFVMSSFNHVSFIESASCSDSGSDSPEDGLNCQTIEVKNSASHSASSQRSERFHQPVIIPTATLSETRCVQSSSLYVAQVSLIEEAGKQRNNSRINDIVEEKKQPFPMKPILVIETSWYTSPEETSGGPSSCASDVYRLGVLLFELFCPFSSREEKSRTMSSLRHRVLPPQLLLKWPKEASFCLWLLHPDPTSRPKMSELLQSEFLNEPRNDFEEREAAIKLREKINEQELLLEFLLLLQQRKEEGAHKLQDTISLLYSDIKEVLERQKFLNQNGGSCLEPVKDDCLMSGLPATNISENNDCAISGSRKRFRPGIQIHNMEGCDDNLDDRDKSDIINEKHGGILLRSSRLMKNFKKLELAYFLMRSRLIKPSGRLLVGQSPISSDGRGSIVVNERSSVSNSASKMSGESREGGWIGTFLDGLCKYLSVSTLRVKADLYQGDLLNSSNLVCSLSFDRDGEYFATAGVNKKIKVFECNTIMNEDRDIHYPVVEMASRSKLSSICWNSYIKSQIASSNFEGVVQVWDVTRSQVVMEMREHERRVWSIDFSSADPTLLASGSDDGSVKLWSINQGTSIGTIKSKANVCSVQFRSDSSRYLAFGSADHKIYYYDVRNSKSPLCTFVGHNKTVSSVKFVDTTSLVSSSTDNTLKLWDLSMCTSRVIDTPVQSFSGHTNVKNFVGLSVSNGYIATGSETNEVFIYHKVFPMPALSYKCQTDQLSGHDTDDAAQFVSSVCWRGQSSTLVAANSSGHIKVLEMV